MTIRFFTILSTVTLTCFMTACDGGGTTSAGGSAGDGGSGAAGGSGGTGAAGGSGGSGGSEPQCGNGQVEDGEQCDDGTGNNDTGACTTGCKDAACGDGLVQAGVEECDEGAQNDDTGACTADCKDAACGDGLVQTGVEECDEGAQNDDTGTCTTGCKDAACGDGFVQTGAVVCDDGAGNDNTAACTAMCTTATCGDGFTQAGVEGCDDGDMIADDRCTNTCTLPECGDGIQQAGEQCDMGARNSNTGACTAMCATATCGDGLIQAGVEQCDMGAQNSDTGACTAMCATATCGDGLIQTGVEQCDMGAQNSNTGACTAMCATATCGDGFTQAGVEPCDDGNPVNGDGCNTNCVVSGTPIWTQTFNGGAGLADGWNGVATDAMGNIYVTGFEGTAGQGYNAITRKYDAAGAVQWTQQYNGAGNGNDEGNGIAVDEAGNVYVTGYAQVSATDIDVLAVKYNGTTGAVIWTMTLPGVPDGVDSGTGIAVNPVNGNVYASGYAVTQAGVGSDLIVAKLDPATGALIWFDFLNGAGNLDDVAQGVAVDATGGIVAAGAVRTASNYDTWVRKYTDNGATFTVVWTRTFNGASNADDAGYGIATDAMGNAVVTGMETVNGQSNNVWLRKYDTNGNTVWTQTYASPSNLNDRGYGVRTDAAGNVVVCGFQAIANTTADIWVRKYSPAGNTLWTQTYNGNADQDDLANGCAVDAMGNVLAAGYETVTGPNNNAWLRKYAP
jgi:cysteine-rich repeat protein